MSLEVFTDPVLGVHTGRGHRVVPPSLVGSPKDDPVAIVVSAGWSTLSSSTTSVDANRGHRDRPSSMPKCPLTISVANHLAIMRYIRGSSRKYLLRPVGS